MQQWDDPKPGFKWPVAVAQPIAAPGTKSGRLSRCRATSSSAIPSVPENPVQVWPGEGSRDEVHYLSGRVLERRFCRWIDGAGYDLEIGERGGDLSFVSWRILPVDDQNCILRIAVYPHLLQNVPAAIRWLPYRLYIGPMLERYLSSVVRGFEWYVSRGEPVPRNQFGSHPWFSAPKSDAE